MDCLPPELKLQLLFLAIEDSPSTLCSLALSNRLFYHTFKANELRLLTHWPALHSDYERIIRLIASFPALYTHLSVLPNLQVPRPPYAVGTICFLRRAMHIDNVITAAAGRIVEHIETVQTAVPIARLPREPSAWKPTLYFHLAVRFSCQRIQDCLDDVEYNNESWLVNEFIDWRRETWDAAKDVRAWIRDDDVLKDTFPLHKFNRNFEGMAGINYLKEVETRAGVPLLKPDWCNKRIELRLSS